MDREFKKLLLTELNMVSYKAGNYDDLSDMAMIKAITVNENMGSIGYTLRPKDIVSLACSETCENLFEEIKEMLPDVKAEPMYPDFPTQVMNISEAEFRFHQMLHYFSTYGIEWLTGEKVSKGWMPEVERTEKTEKDRRLMQYRVLELVPEEDVCRIALSRILGKRERMTIPETMIVMMAVKIAKFDDIKDLRITFKENTALLFDEALKLVGDEKLIVMKISCQHTGDVLKNIFRVLQQKKYHLHTSEKRAFVKLLESYPAGDFRGNLMRSKMGREKNLMILQRLDYNVYSRSTDHLSAVNDLRNDKIKSWEGIAKNMLENHVEGALDFVAKRPGTMLRMVSWILTLGYSEEEVTEKLCTNAKMFSAQTIVVLLTKFSNMTREKIHDEFVKEESKIKYKYENLYRESNPENLEFRKSYLIRQEENKYACGYRNQIKKLENCRLQELCEWSIASIDDEEDEEIKYLEKDYEDYISDIRQSYHIKTEALEKELKSLNIKYSRFKRRDKERDVIRESLRCYYISTGMSEEDAKYRSSIIGYDKNSEELKASINSVCERISATNNEMEEEINLVISRMKEETKLDREIIHSKYEKKRKISSEKIKEINRRYKEKIEFINSMSRNEKLEAEIAKIKAEYDKRIENAPEIRANLEKENAKELEMAKTKEELGYKRLESLPVMRRILSKVLKQHLLSVETGLRNKKVYLDMDEFDLEHSQILANNKSEEGGYIPSGIAYKIPEDSQIVRFFVYWNDKNRVDIDLHANGVSTSGENFHIGWNSSFRDCGVLHSGDITHSNAAEYIDIDLSKPIHRIYTNIHLFSGKESLSDVDECYVGMMAVNKTGKDVKLYDRANCYFSHEVKMNCSGMFYGYVDVQNHFVRFIGRPDEIGTSKWNEDSGEDIFTLEKYMKILFESQETTVVDSMEEADVVLSMGKSIYENGLSLVDENFFMDAM